MIGMMFLFAVCLVGCVFDVSVQCHFIVCMLLVCVSGLFVCFVLLLLCV